jgi:hypothetical protein
MVLRTHKYVTDVRRAISQGTYPVSLTFPSSNMVMQSRRWKPLVSSQMPRFSLSNQQARSYRQRHTGAVSFYHLVAVMRTRQTPPRNDVLRYQARLVVLTYRSCDSSANEALVNPYQMVAIATCYRRRSRPLAITGK